MDTHTGRCHCGAVTYEAKATITKAISCNCSNCYMRGLVLEFIPANHFTLLTGEDDLIDYRFNKNAIGHMVCKKCGIEAFGKAKNKENVEMVALNIRCINDIDLDSLVISPVDGKNW